MEKLKIQKLIEAHDRGEYCGDPFKGVDFSKNAIVVGHINYCDYSNDEQYIEYFGKYMRNKMNKEEILKELRDMLEYCEKGKEYFQAINRLIVKIELTFKED